MNIILRTGGGIKGCHVISEEPGHVVKTIFLQQIGGDQVANIDFSDMEHVSVNANPFTTGWEPIQLSCFVDVPPFRPLNYTLDLTDRWVEQEDGPVRTEQASWDQPSVEGVAPTHYYARSEPPTYSYVRMTTPNTNGSVTLERDGYITFDDYPEPRAIISRNEFGVTTVRLSSDTEEPEPQPERTQEENEMSQRINAIREMLEGRLEADREGEQNAERN